MKLLARSLLVCSIFIGLSISVFAQGFRIEGTAPSPVGAEPFTSIEGRFIIELPKRISGFSPVSINAPNGTHIEGSTFNWRTSDGVFMVGFLDRQEMLEKAGKEVLDFLRDSILTQAQGRAKLVSETDITLDGHPGRQLKLEFPDGIALARIYVVGNRIYQAIASLSTANKAKEPQALKVLESFKLLTKSDVEAEVKRRVAEATPKPLPQEPVAKRAKTDAEDEGLQGRVKTVFTEAEDLSGTWSVSRRKPESMDYYNEQGNLTKAESYDYKGNPFDITVYGYLDGERVSKFSTIQYEYDPPPMLMTSAAGEPPLKYDPRYSYKFKFKYDEKGNLTEKVFYGNNGKLWLRYVYSYKGQQREELVYDEKGSLNQKYLYTLDDKGNEIEETIFDVKDNSVERKYTYTYEFDSEGNWIKRVTKKLFTKEGKSSFEPYSVTYRTIAYY